MGIQVTQVRHVLLVFPISIVQIFVQVLEIAGILLVMVFGVPIIDFTKTAFPDRIDFLGRSIDYNPDVEKIFKGPFHKSSV